MKTRVLCPTAMAAVLLTTILELEGHRAVWFHTDDGIAVATCAPLTALDCSIQTCETALHVPAHQRTKRPEVTNA